MTRLGEAIEALARQAHLLPQPTHAPTCPVNLLEADEDDLERWVQLVAAHMSIEVEPIQSSFIEVEGLVQGVSPAILEVVLSANENEVAGRRYLVLAKGGAKITLLAPDLSLYPVAPQLVRDALCRAIEAPYAEVVNEILARAQVPEAKRPRVRHLFLKEQLSTARVAHGWMLRHLPGASYVAQARAAKIFPLAAVVLGTILLQQGLLLVTWGIIGGSALQGHFDWVWLMAWAALLLTGIPLQMMMNTAGARLGTHIGGIFRTTMLYGVLHLDPETIRHEGTGHFLDRIMDADVVQYGGISSVLTVLLASSQLIAAFGILLLGAGGLISAALLGGIVIVMLVLGWQHWSASQWGMTTYRNMTNNLVERLIGHRTRLAQQDPSAWHTQEDRELAQYLEFSESEARFGNWLGSLPQAWLILGLASSIGAFVFLQLSTTELAISLGGVLLAQQALSAIALQIAFFIPLVLAWRQVRPIFRAARSKKDKSLAAAFTLEHARRIAAPSTARFASGEPSAHAQDDPLIKSGQAGANPSSDYANVSLDRPTPPPAPLVTLRNVMFRYQERARRALDDVSLEINPGDRILAEGPSGGGKSTLASLLAGLQIPDSGLLLFRGYDRASLGSEAWRERVVVAPQFHENHVFAETLAFNLLMGRRWPAMPEDEQEAFEICRELGLDSLIARMPSGLHQIVGESGWQLSHGERSRLFIARALLQRSELIILDESFAALDPENLARALRTVLNRAPTLLVIAHP
ncbi:MAG TPA: ABC transporter ATP-binding protein [Anaerolineae bacterium]|nr:ABC transporter ATP-binding protein [Anaerolineae bacterium]